MASLPRPLARAGERLREAYGRRLGSAALALALELGLILIVVTLGREVTQPEKPQPALVSMALHASDVEKKPDEKKPEPQKPVARAEPAAPPSIRPPQPSPPHPPVPVPTPRPPAFIPVNPQQMASFDISKLAKTPAPSAAAGKGQVGPADSEAQPDSRVVGTGPNGQTLYAAAWYREPYHDELAGYLSTATSTGWGLIACKTAPSYRVVDCVPIDEYPQGSNIARAVVAAAWQFQVQPPRVNGQPRIGDWVRIRIDYGLKKASY